ncbi:MAG: PilN domain-containing protein [Holophagales bacterium]|jgi:Tfp pilus assembly protein PilN|nr:PilN domain-containing protein [Holophagales bacterium]
MVNINLGNDSLTQTNINKKSVKDVPAELSSDTKSEDRQKLTVAILLFLIFAGLGGMYYFWLNGNINREIERNATLTGEKNELEPYLKLEQQFRNQKDALGKKEEELIRLKKQQQLPVYFLQELGNSIPENVWLVKITSKGSKVEIRAESLTDDAIYQFRDNLAARDQWFENINYPGATRRDNRLEFTLTLDLINSV